jgi:putative ubiquitin-RnfH superfamily antitoxin RatB of RatAB toxin-antitoxin module
MERQYRFDFTNYYERIIMNLLSIVAGIDVSKDKLDIFIHPLNKYKTFNNKKHDFIEIYKLFKGN